MPTINNKSINFIGQTFFVGLDVHKNSWTVTVRTLAMEVAHFTQAPQASQLAGYLNNKYPGGKFLSAYEAGFCGISPHDALCKLGIENIVFHAADLPRTDKQMKNKTDLFDSRAIAHYLEKEMLKGIYIMSVTQQELRSLYRLREAKVKDVTRSTNRLRSLLYYFGIQLPMEFSNKDYISNRFLSWLGTVKLVTCQGTDTLHQYIQELIYQREQLLLITRKLRKAVSTNCKEQYQSLLSVPGIGPITAMAILTEIGDLSRFKDPDQFCSYLGLIPGEQSTGETIYSLGIQPRCNRHLRPLLIEAAWVAIRKCPVLLAYYKKHVGKNSKKAIVKVARKLALIAKAVVLNKTTYSAEYTTKKMTRLICNI